MKRVYYIDCLRVFAAFLVVATHCNFAPSDLSNKIYTQILGVIGSPSSELFLTLSGALLIPVKTSEREFYKKRFSKLMPPFLFWSFFGIWFAVYANGVSSDLVPKMLFSIPFHTFAVGPFWFIYVISGMYLFAPIITPWINAASPKKIRFFLYLWGISLLMPYTNFFLPGFYSLSGNFTSPLYMFSGYIGYMMLGFYLRTFRLPSPMHKISVNVVVFLLTLLPLIIVGLKAPIYRPLVMDNLQILSAVQVITIFSIFKANFNTETPFTQMCKRITNYTFGVYLIHTFIIWLAWIIIGGHEKYPAYIGLPMAIVLSILLSLLFVVMCSKVKYVSKLVGCK